MSLRNERSDRYYLCLLAAIAAFIWITKYHPFLDTPRIFDADARQHVYWTYKFRDPELFRNDLLTTYISSPKVAPLGYQALYYLGAQIVDPLLFSQMLSLVLVLISAALLFKISVPIGNIRGSAVATFLFVVCYFLYHYSGGLPRSFAFPLLLGGLYVLRQRAWWRLAGMLVVQSLLYPPILVNTAALAVLTWWRARRPPTSEAFWTPLLALGLALAVVAGIRFGLPVSARYEILGNIVSRREARSMPEFGAQGRTSFFEATFLQTLLNRRAGIRIDRFYGLGGLILAMFIVCGPSRFVVPRLAKDLLWTSLLSFSLAHLVLFQLYLPARYVLFTFFLAALLIVAANVETTRDVLLRRCPGLVRLLTGLRRHRGLLWLALGGLMVAFTYAQDRYFVLSEIRVERPEMNLYRFLHNLPKDALIAGHPMTLNNVPLMAQRKVLVNQELAEPFYTGYYTRLRQRLFDTFTAYYTDDVQQLWQFIRRYGVDYILVDTRHFEAPFLAGPIFYEPFGSFIRPQLSSRRHFALLEIPPEQQVYEQGPYRVVSFIEPLSASGRRAVTPSPAQAQHAQEKTGQQGLAPEQD